MNIIEGGIAESLTPEDLSRHIRTRLLIEQHFSKIGFVQRAHESVQVNLIAEKLEASLEVAKNYVAILALNFEGL